METAVLDQAVSAVADHGGKNHTFALAGGEYGIGILKVKEIIGLMPITTVPKTPGYVKGVINVRGKVIPVADLWLKFDMEAMEYNDRTYIIVVEVKGAEQTILMGIVVDSVSEVLNIKDADIEDTPNFVNHLNTAFIPAWPIQTTPLRSSSTSTAPSVKRIWPPWLRRHNGGVLT